MELWLAKVCPERANYAFSEKFRYRPKTGFLTHNFDYRYVSKSIKGSIDADFHLGFNKTLSQKNGSMGWDPGPAKISKTPQLVAAPQRTLHRKQKTFVFDFDYKTCWIRRGFEQLSNSIAWRVLGLQSSAKKRSRAGPKGLNIPQIKIITCTFTTTSNPFQHEVCETNKNQIIF